jgi:hypothetical protein
VQPVLILPVRAVCGTSTVRPHTHITTPGNCAVPPWQAINFERRLFKGPLSRRTCISCAGLTIARATTSSLNQRCSRRELCGQEVQREARRTSAAISESSSRTSSRTFGSPDTSPRAFRHDVGHDTNPPEHREAVLGILVVCSHCSQKLRACY